MRIGRISNTKDEGFLIAQKQEMQFIEICCNSREEGEALASDKENVLRRVQSYGIDVSSVGRWNHDLVENGALSAEKKQSYLTLLDTAVELGAKTFVAGINYDESISLFKNYCLAVEFFGELLARADGRIKISVQNCDWNNYVVSPTQWKVVLGELPELCLKYDPSHAYNRHADYLAEMSDWGERIAHMHIKGTTHAGNRPVDDPPAGMDDIRWRSVFAVLYARGYNGDLSIEPHSGTWRGELGDAGVRFTRDFIRQFVF